MADLLQRPADELADLVRTGEVTSRELTEQALERAEALQEPLNAFVHLDHDGALAAADAVAGGDARPFAGVPIAIKDNVPVKGLPLGFGCKLFDGFVARHDAHLVTRLRDAGFVVVGKTTLPELGILPSTEGRHLGPTRNPWDLERTPGGSSGGSAAAVAAGIVPLAHGNDGGGSTRIPAACCGLVGLKPSRGRISRGPDSGDSLLAVDGVLTRTVLETARLLDVLAGYEVGDATWAPPPSAPFAQAAQTVPVPRRIGLVLDPPLGGDVDPECRAATERTAAVLEGLGHQVEPTTIALPGSAEEVTQLFGVVFSANISLQVLYGQLVGGRAADADTLEPLSLALWEANQQVPAYGYLGAVSRLQQWTRSMIAQHAEFDVLLTPALAGRPPRIGEIDGQAEDPVSTFDVRSAAFTPFTPLCNVSGQPAISIPAGVGPDGLPSAVQLIGSPLGEDVLLMLAAQLEQAQPWAGLRAPLATA